MQEEDNTLAKHAKPEVISEFTLDNGKTVKFRIMRWSPTKVFNRLPEYGTVIGVPLVMYNTAEQLAGQDYEEKIGMALIQLFSGLEERVLAEFLKSILDEVYSESGVSISENFDEMFILHPYLVIEIASKVLEVNYGPFFKRGFGNLLTQFQTIKTLNEH
jgi:hypothetical protein